MFYSYGIIRYDKSDGDRVTVSVEQSIADYYYALIPKYYRTVKPRWPAHVTVVSPIDPIIHWDKWRNKESQIASFVYDPTILYENSYWWFNLWSIEMEDIRKELGLTIKSRITIPPPGYSKCFHCTLAKDFII